MERSGYVPGVWGCFVNNGFDAQWPGCIMKQQTARPESHALQRYRVLDFDDQSRFLHAELCHRRVRTAILNILYVIGVLGYVLPIPRNRIWMRGRVQKISRKQHHFSHFGLFGGGAQNRESANKTLSFKVIKNLRPQIGSASNSSLTNLC